MTINIYIYICIRTMYGDYKYKQHMWTLYIRTSYHFYIYIYVYKSHIWPVHIKAI